jgi:2-polyprenyl-3-methyl-5-hydroxy-6-metoxy-1,4-benzoquinol methylase
MSRREGLANRNFILLHSFRSSEELRSSRREAPDPLAEIIRHATTGRFGEAVFRGNFMRLSQLSSQAKTHLANIRGHYEKGLGLTNAALAYRDILAAYYNLLIPASASVLEVGCGAEDLLSRLQVSRRCGVDVSPRQIGLAKEKVPDGTFYVQAGEELDLPTENFDYIIVSETINQAADVQSLFHKLRSVSHANTRLIVNIYNSLWHPVIWLGTKFGLRNRQPESNWLSKEDVAGLLHLTGWELIRCESRILCPVKLAGLEQLLNRFVAPLLQPLCLTVFAIARLVPLRQFEEKTVSVVVPARNEAGNVEAVVKRTPAMGVWTELIFVEGDSKDNTWDEMQRAKTVYPHKRIKILQQSGKGGTPYATDSPLRKENCS